MLVKWILANGVGMPLGFLAFVNVVFFVGFDFQFDLYWTEPRIRHRCLCSGPERSRALPSPVGRG
jgi:hypothetical protein